MTSGDTSKFQEILQLFLCSLTDLY